MAKKETFMAGKAAVKKVQSISPGLGEKKAIVLTNLMRNGRIGDSDLMKLLDLKSANAASYYRKHLEDQGIVKGYTVEIDWNKLGYPAEFIVLAEGETMEANYDMEKELLEALDEYQSKTGDLFILPSGTGRVMIEEVYGCFGERHMSIIRGRATSEQDAITYSRYYIAEKFPNVKTTFLLVKGKSIENFFIQKGYLDVMKGSFVEDKSIELPEEFRRRFPSLAGRGPAEKK